MLQRILFIVSSVLSTVRSHELNSSDFDPGFLEDLSAMVPDPPASRRARGLYGVASEGLCPPECLCLSEIQVRTIIMIKMKSMNILQVLCNTGNLAEFPTNLPNVTQDISITNQNIQIVPKYVSQEAFIK